MNDRLMTAVFFVRKRSCDALNRKTLTPFQDAYPTESLI